MNTPIRAVLYCRKSNDDEGESIAQQKDWADGACRKENIAVIAEFADQSKAGWDTAKRDEFRKMLDFCRQQYALKRPVDAVVCWHPNRFSRSDSLETARFLCELRDAGVHRMFTHSHGWVDFRSPEARMLFSLEQEVGNHRYVRDLAQGVLRGRKAKAKKGDWCGGVAPYGYVIDGTRLVPHPTNADAIRWAFETYATKDVGLATLCRGLADRGFRTAKGGKVWSRPSIAQMLRNPIYLGELVYNRRTESRFLGSFTVPASNPNDPRKTRPNPESEVIRVPGTHPALVSREVFDQVQKRLASNRTRTTPLKQNPFMLTGLLKCGGCGAPMFGRTLKSGNGTTGKKGKAHRYYCCSRWNAYGDRSGCYPHMIREERLLSALTRKLSEAYFNRDTLDQIRNEVRRQETTEDGSVTERSLTVRIADLDQRIKKGRERLLTVDDALVDDCQRQLLDWKNELAKLESELDTYRASRPVSEDLDTRMDRMMDQMGKFQRLLAESDPDQARTVLRELIDRVELHFDHKNTGKIAKSIFARGLIYIHPNCLLTDLSSATTSRTRSAR
jgi:site-specific DNA recombinase